MQQLESNLDRFIDRKVIKHSLSQSSNHVGVHSLQNPHNKDHLVSVSHFATKELILTTDMDIKSKSSMKLNKPVGGPPMPNWVKSK